MMLGGCSNEGDRREGAASAAPPPASDAAETVTTYFDAIAARDCARMRRATGGAIAKALDEHGCDHDFDEFVRNEMVILKVEAPTPDGRDPGVMLVRVQAKRRGKPQTIVVGLEAVDGRWAVTRL